MVMFLLSCRLNLALLAPKPAPGLHTVGLPGSQEILPPGDEPLVGLRGIDPDFEAGDAFIDPLSAAPELDVECVLLLPDLVLRIVRDYVVALELNGQPLVEVSPDNPALAAVRALLTQAGVLKEGAGTPA